MQLTSSALREFSYNYDFLKAKTGNTKIDPNYGLL